MAGALTFCILLMSAFHQLSDPSPHHTVSLLLSLNFFFSLTSSPHGKKQPIQAHLPSSPSSLSLSRSRWCHHHTAEDARWRPPRGLVSLKFINPLLFFFQKSASLKSRPLIEHSPTPCCTARPKDKKTKRQLHPYFFNIIVFLVLSFVQILSIE